MKKIAIYGFLLILASLQVACKDWLDVKPKTAVEEDVLFSTEQGFKENLTGIYLLLASKDLYGRELSYGITDILAQRYEPGGGSDIPELKFADNDWYKFPSVKTEGYVNSIWKNMYKVIANINNFLTWIDKNKEVLTTPDYYEIMKGEALGLRAFVYFDLLRLYGPIYDTQAGPSSLSLPYRTEFNREEKSFSTAEEVIGFILRDIEAAEALLVKDPMYIEFPSGFTTETLGLDDFLRYRFKRMNQYAVKALAARVYLWKGDKENAARMAKAVIDGKDKEGNNYFALVMDNSTDRIFSTELLFSISVPDFDDQVEVDFKVSPSSTFYYLQDRSRVDKMFDVSVDGANDMRYREGQGFSFEAKSAVSLKYQQKGAFSSAVQNTVPLIRLSEVYYILAERESDYKVSATWLSRERAARGCDDVVYKSKDDREYNIMKEYRKEFYAEGQLWYYYKRHAYKTFQDCPLKIDMTEANYRFSIPDNEVEFGKVDK